MAVRHPSHESVALSAPALVRGIQAQVQLEAVAGVYDTNFMSSMAARVNQLLVLVPI